MELATFFAVVSKEIDHEKNLMFQLDFLGMFFLSRIGLKWKKALEETAWSLGWVRKVKANMFCQVLAIPLFLV